MNTCKLCVRGPDDTQDSRYCEKVGHRVFHSSPACPHSFEPRETQQQSACRPVMLTNPLVCPRCRSLNVCAGVCQACSARVYP